jgi:ABC-type hemin transport system substrate-binding protein
VDLERPRRIVSLVPSTTESVCVLGAASALVGCTRYCSEPATALRSVARVGGTKNPAREAVLALEPDLVLANAEENRLEDLEWLAARVEVLVQTPRTIPQAADDLRALAARLGSADAAQLLLWRLEAWLAAAAADSLGAPPLRVYYAIWQKPWMSVGPDTYIHDVLSRLGLVNVCGGALERYPECEPSAAVAAGVEAVLLASEPWEFDAAQRDAIAARGSFGPAKLVLCDGRDFCWHGVRMADGFGRAVELVRSLRVR